jgi:hypothetical protein
MLYRALVNLSNGVRAGQPFKVERLSSAARAILEAQGRIAPVHAPPILAIEGWEQRAAILEGLGIVALDELIEANLPQYASWQREALAVLTPRHCKHCGG